MYADSLYTPGGGCMISPKVLTHYGTSQNNLRPAHKRYGNVDDSVLEKTFMLGFEKNPWFVVYSKVEAKTAPVKPFSPLSRPVNLYAESFSKPFGGTIGPWIYDSWPVGLSKSSGSFSKATDKLLPPTAGDTQSSGGTNQISTSRLSPNYSLYPGDNLGLNSRENLLAFLSERGANGLRLKYKRQNYTSDAFSPVGKTELSAISPNVFDATYYSIEPDFENYKNLFEITPIFTKHFCVWFNLKL